jgi:hypothetical protein
MSRTAKHTFRRIRIFAIPLLLGIVIGIIRVTLFGKNQINIPRMMDIATSMIGLWGTSLGFIITAESILVAFDGSYLTKEIKQSEHFKTVVYTYTLTCVELLFMIAFFSIIIIENYFSTILFGILYACLIVSLLDILLCLIFLGFLIFSTCKTKKNN